MSTPELLLSNQLCFLVYRLDRAIGARYRPLLAELGLTYPQYLAMMVLWEREELGVGELCDLLVLDTGTVSPLLKRLEAAGFVERRRKPEDERAVAVRLTEAGRALEQMALSVPGAMASCLLVSGEEYGSIRETLTTLIGRLEGGDCGK
jgi:MarR family transcriptional regulator, organic hydroperoxide resistance regulator